MHLFAFCYAEKKEQSQQHPDAHADINQQRTDKITAGKSEVPAIPDQTTPPHTLTEQAATLHST